MGLFEAIRNGDSEELVRLIAADPGLVYAEDGNGIRPVMLALYNGKGEFAGKIRDVMDTVTIWEAAALGELETVQQLVEESPDIRNAVAPDGFNPLGLAAFFSHADVLAWLLAQGADPNKPSQNQMGVYPINSAAANRNEDNALELVRLLVEAGADVDAAQRSGWTPLHQASAHGFESLASYLLESGADRTLKGENGQNAADLARDAGFVSLADALSADQSK